MGFNKDMTMAYRIMTMPPMAIATRSHADLPIVESEIADIAKCTKIDVSNVAEFIYMNPKEQWSIISDIPNMAPLFPLVFFDWSDPPQMIASGELRAFGDQTQHGMLAASFDSDHQYFKNVKSQIETSNLPVLGDNIVMVREVVSNAKWVTVFSYWRANTSAPTVGRPIWMGAHIAAFIDQTGKPLFYTLSGPALDVKDEGFNVNDVIHWPIAIVGLAISFAHCRNVEIAERKADMGRKWHKNTRSPVLVYKQIKIEPIKKILRSDGASESTGLVKAMHICRGHFATYSPDHPLFGKYVGTFWKPDHVRGSAEHGEVVKSYAVASTTEA